MGGRVASMIADEAYGSGNIAGLLCLGYPFHPPGKPNAVANQASGRISARPRLSARERAMSSERATEVETYTLSDRIELLWLEDGDHDLKPRKSISGFSTADHLKTLAETVSGWTARICR